MKKRNCKKLKTKLYKLEKNDKNYWNKNMLLQKQSVSVKNNRLQNDMFRPSLKKSTARKKLDLEHVALKL